MTRFNSRLDRGVLVPVAASAEERAVFSHDDDGHAERIAAHAARVAEFQKRIRAAHKTERARKTVQRVPS